MTCQTLLIIFSNFLILYKGCMPLCHQKRNRRDSFNLLKLEISRMFLRNYRRNHLLSKVEINLVRKLLHKFVYVYSFWYCCKYLAIKIYAAVSVYFSNARYIWLNAFHLIHQNIVLKDNSFNNKKVIDISKWCS